MQCSGALRGWLLPQRSACFEKRVGKQFCGMCGWSECLVETPGLNGNYAVAFDFGELSSSSLGGPFLSCKCRRLRCIVFIGMSLRLGLNVSPFLCDPAHMWILFACTHNDHSQFVPLNLVCYSQPWGVAFTSDLLELADLLPFQIALLRSEVNQMHCIYTWVY